MVAGADSIEDLDVLRHGGLSGVFAAVYAPSTLGSFLRFFTWGHTLQVEAAARNLLAALAARTPLLPGAEKLAYVDVVSLLQAAIDTIDGHSWIPVRYPGAVFDDDTQQWISDAEVAETTYSAFETTTYKVTARLVVRRVRELNPAPPGQEELFPLWRYHAFLTDTDLPTVQADLTHRGPAIIEQLFADLIDGPSRTCPRAGSPPTPPG